MSGSDQAKAGPSCSSSSSSARMRPLGEDSGPAHRQKLDGVRLAIIVPFRDLDPKQKRKAHLERFAPYMANYFANAEGVLQFRTFVIEQSDDGRKFNRGKLLNIGFNLAKDEGFDTFVFHDVDLLPAESLKKWYTSEIREGIVVHIARCWDRYNESRTYLGGIVGFSATDFTKVDGFPNTYWGWGGEDDELSKRVRQYKLNVIGPDRHLKNAIRDLEEMNLKQKLDWLRSNKDVKNNIKWENNDEHDLIRRQSPISMPRWWGLAGLQPDGFKVLARDDERFPDTSIITVDVLPNFNDDGTEHVTEVKNE